MGRIRFKNACRRGAAIRLNSLDGKALSQKIDDGIIENP